MEALWSGSIGEWSEGAAGPLEPTLVEPGLPSADDGVAGASDAGSTSPVTTTVVSSMAVEVIRSPRRRKSVSARIVDGRIVVRMPQWMSKAQEDEYVASMVAKLVRQHTAAAVDLPTRAGQLARRYGLPEPTSIRWVANQQHRWGSCTPSTGEIRITDRIAGFPAWVIDAVIVHELAHLVHLDHGPQFWALANRYPKMERAHGFLIAKQLAPDDLDADSPR